MRLYHGSNMRITEIDLAKSKPHKDFGAGFYLTDDFARAVRMANRTTAIEAIGTPEITPFIFLERHCPKDLRILKFNKRTAQWALFVMENRDREKPFQHDYDIVIGPVADSRVDPILQDFKNKHGKNTSDPDKLEELAEQLRYPGSEYLQYCFCTPRAIQQLILDL